MVTGSPASSERALESFVFREWHAGRAVGRRSKDRAAALRDALGLPLAPLPVLAVVGSKGKGTTATYASAVLAASGLKVGTITSPGFRSNRERIRVDGAAIGRPQYERLLRRVDEATRTLPPPQPGEGYLSPGGIYLAAGLTHFREQACDVAVVEAGRGGLSDELSLYEAEVVALTRILGEHLDELGGSIESIARDKIGIVSPRTSVVVMAAQTPGLDDLVAASARERGGPALRVVTSGRRPPFGLSRSLPGFNGMNAALGVTAGVRTLAQLGVQPAGAARLEYVLRSVRLPARLSHHEVARGDDPARGARVILDAAVERTGVACALAYADARYGTRDHHVLVSLPDDKDLEGARLELQGRKVTHVVLDTYLRYERDRSYWPQVPFEDVDWTALGPRLLVLGTISFVGLVLDRVVAADLERCFDV